MEEEVRGGPLKMILKDGSSVDFLANCVNIENGVRAGEEEERLDLVKGCASESPLRDSAFPKGSFSKLTSFIKFMELRNFCRGNFSRGNFCTFEKIGA